MAKIKVRMDESGANVEVKGTTLETCKMLSILAHDLTKLGVDKDLIIAAVTLGTNGYMNNIMQVEQL